MKKIIYSILPLMALLLLLPGCTNSDDLFGEKNISKRVTMKVNMPEEGTTRVGMAQDGYTLHLNCYWRELDEVQVFIYQNEDIYEIGKVRVSDVLPSKKEATISFDLPKQVQSKEPYSVYAFSGIDGRLAFSNKGIVSALCDANLVRDDLLYFDAPLFCKVEARDGKLPELHFKHFGTYEVLHLKNATSKMISFKHTGFVVDNPWYYKAATVSLDDEGNAQYVAGSLVTGEVSGESYNIHRGETEKFLSWYMPKDGQMMKDAYLKAIIDGKSVTSKNKKSSDVTIERAHAYHMYATWDGKDLTFDNGDPVKSKKISVSPSSIDFGTIAVDEGTSKTFVVSNTGEDNVTFKVARTTGVFSITDSGKDITLGVGQRKTFTVVFKPVTEETTYNQTVDITSDANDGTQYLSLTGKSKKKRIEQVIPPEIRDPMEPYITIYDGANPPNIEGSYLVSPIVLTYNSVGDFEPGTQFADCYIRFKNQDMTSNTLDYEEKQASSTQTGEGCFISGEGNNFSVFFNTTGIYYGDYNTITFKTALVISGVKTSQGIKNLQYAFVMVDKSYDPQPELISVGSFRVFEDSDRMSYHESWSFAPKRNMSAKQKNGSLPMIMQYGKLPDIKK